MKTLKKVIYFILTLMFISKLFSNSFLFHFLLYTDPYIKVIEIFKKHSCIDHIDNLHKVHLQNYLEPSCTINEDKFNSDYLTVKENFKTLFRFGYTGIYSPAYECTVFFHYSNDTGICYREEETYPNYKILGFISLLFDMIPFSTCLEYPTNPLCILVSLPKYRIYDKWGKYTYTGMLLRTY